ncbi:MAG: hypothetical protein ABIB71_01725 [Candidatus Woesearchaeota archaeon]
MATGNISAGIIMFMGGTLLAVGSGGSVTGAFLGTATLQPLCGFASGVALLCGSLALFSAARKKGKEGIKFDLENILKEDITSKQKKGLRRYGQILIRAHHGSGKDSALNNLTDYRLELGEINLILSNYNSMSLSERKAFEDRFNCHKFKEFGKEIISIDAPRLNSADNQKGRGNLRYIFDAETKKYLGLAQHKNKGGYRWVK